MTRLVPTLTLTVIFTVGVATVSNGQVPSFQAPAWQLSLSSFVSEGTYDTQETTRLTFTALSLRRTFPKGDLGVRVPWLDIRSTGSVVVFQGVVFPALTPRLAGAGARTTRRTTRESGLGDVGITGRLFLVEESGGRPAVDLTARVELPTGDETRGLGMGAASAEIGLEVANPLGSAWVALASASYTISGRPPDLHVQNPWEYAVGIGAYPVRSILLSASYEQWRSVIPGAPIGRDILTTATIAAGRRLRILTSAQFPLSNQASAFGAGGGLAVRF